MNLRTAQGAILFLLLLCWAAVARAHDRPDVPVRTFLTGDGTMRVTVEIDPRCFEANPVEAPYLVPAKLAALPEARKEECRRLAADMVGRYVEFTLDPVGRVLPEFTFTYTGKNGAPLATLTDPEAPVMLTGEWQTTLPTGVTGWHLRTTKAYDYSVIFQNIIGGEVHPRFAVVFPEQTSFTLDLSSLASVGATSTPGSVPLQNAGTDHWGTFFSYLHEGFHHIVPEGLDHILFVLGIFLLSRSWRPLLAQVTVFTLAHSITLALASFKLVRLSPHVVEPIIAASIAVVAIENIFHRRYTHWRLLIVFIFGLVHGLGFAGKLIEDNLPDSSLLVALVSFNLGVEGGQLAVIAAAFGLSCWIRNPQQYRRWIVIPGSLAIAACGVFWTVQRIFWSK